MDGTEEERRAPQPHPLTLAEIREGLSDAPLFLGIDIDSLEGHLARIQGLRLRDGDVLLAPEQKNSNIYIILSGKLRVHLDDTGFPPLLVMERGECAGEISIIDQDNPSAYVISEGESRLLVIDQDVLWTLVDNSHALARNLLYTLSQRMRFGHSVILDGFEAQRRWQHYATVDALTDLHNRRWLNMAFGRHLERCRTSELPLAVLMLDIDHFKLYNDEHGHPAGDRALASVAGTLSDHLRPTDVAVRYGGEEFVVLLPDTDMDGAVGIAERLREAVAATAITDREGNPLPPVTISLGVAESRSDSKEGGERLLARADEGLYRAKNGGRNQVAKG